MSADRSYPETGDSSSHDKPVAQEPIASPAPEATSDTGPATEPSARSPNNMRDDGDGKSHGNGNSGGGAGGGGPGDADDPGASSGGRQSQFVELLKVTFSVSAAFAMLVAYGFLSEAASFQFLGLPQLQSDVLEVAEQGGRNFVDSFATLRLRGTVALAGSIGALVWLWWRRSHHQRLYKAICSVRSLQVAQILTAIALLGLLWSLVDVKSLTRASGSVALQETVTHIRRWQREQTDWNPRREFARVEALSFEVGPLGWACRAVESHPGNSVLRPLGKLVSPLCFSESDYALELGDGNDAARGLRQAQMRPPSLGIPTRKTEAARVAARDVFGQLFAATLFAAIWVLLLRVWRRWTQRAHRRAPASSTATASSVPEPANRGFFEASRLLVEPLMLLVLMLCLGLIPGAYGVLAHEGVGMQPVMVRLKATPAKTPTPTNDRPAQTSIDPGSGAQSHESSDVGVPQERICNLGMVDEVAKAINKLHDAWRDLYQTRPDGQDEHDQAQPDDQDESEQAQPREPSAYEQIWNAFRLQVDKTVDKVAKGECPEAYARLWRVLPREPQFSTRLKAAQYLWERWTELQRRQTLIRFGYLVTYPRGKNSDRLLLADALAPSTTDQALRVSLQPIWVADADSVELIDDALSTAVNNAASELYASPDQCKPIATLAHTPSPQALAAMIELYQARILTKDCSGVLITQIGTQAGMLRESHPLLHTEAVNLLASIVGKGLRVTREHASARELSPSLTPTASESGKIRSENSMDADGEPDLAPQSAADYRAAATALHLAGGPWAARALVKVACEQLSLSPDHWCGDPTRWPAAVAQLDSAAMNRSGTLVTAAGFLANDASASLRQLGMDDGDCAPSKNGPGTSCNSPIVSARATLDRLLEHVARNRDGEGAPQIAHSFNNRRAACAALALSGSSSANHALERTMRGLIAERNAELLEFCIGSTPTRMSARLRDELRNLVQGSWPPVAAADTTQAADTTPAADQAPRPDTAPSSRLRASALSELWESGLYFEDELLLAVLNARDAGLRSHAAKFIEDVDADAMGKRLWDCAKATKPLASDPQSLRCLRAIKLLDANEDGDNGLSGSLIDQFAATADADAVIHTEICTTLIEFAARGGLDARLWLSERSDATTRCAQQQSGKSTSDQDDARRIQHLMDFKAKDSETASEKPGGDDSDPTMQQLYAALTGDQDVITTLQAQARAGTSEQRESAFVVLSKAGANHAGAIAPDLLIGGDASVLTYHAAQFIEDGDASEATAALLNCAQDKAADGNRRQRCLQGMALLTEGFVPNADVIAQVREVGEQSGMKSAACLALNEFAARGGEPAPADCTSQAPEPDSRRRWARNLLRLLDDLIKQARGEEKTRLDSAREELRRELAQPSNPPSS